MFNTVSLTGTGIVVFVLVQVLSYFNIIVPETQVQSAVEAIIQIVSFLMIIYGQIRRADMAYGLFRKVPEPTV